MTKPLNWEKLGLSSPSVTSQQGKIWQSLRDQELMMKTTLSLEVPVLSSEWDLSKECLCLERWARMINPFQALECMMLEWTETVLLSPSKDQGKWALNRVLVQDSMMLRTALWRDKDIPLRLGPRKEELTLLDKETTQWTCLAQEIMTVPSMILSSKEEYHTSLVLLKGMAELTATQDPVITMFLLHLLMCPDTFYQCRMKISSGCEGSLEENYIIRFKFFPKSLSSKYSFHGVLGFWGAIN